MTVTRYLLPSISVSVPHGSHDRVTTITRATQEQALAKGVSSRSILLIYEDRHPRPSIMLDGGYGAFNAFYLDQHLPTFLSGRCDIQDSELSAKMLKALREAILAHKDFLLSSGTNPERI